MGRESMLDLPIPGITQGQPRRDPPERLESSNQASRANHEPTSGLLYSRQLIALLTGRPIPPITAALSSFSHERPTHDS